MAEKVEGSVNVEKVTTVMNELTTFLADKLDKAPESEQDGMKITHFLAVGVLFNKWMSIQTLPERKNLNDLVTAITESIDGHEVETTFAN